MPSAVCLTGPMPTVVVLGMSGLTTDVVAQVLQRETDCVEPAGFAARPAAVAVLVDPDQSHWLRAELMGLPVVLVRSQDLEDEDVVDGVLRGADAVLSDDVSVEQLLGAVRAVGAGGSVIAPVPARAIAAVARRGTDSVRCGEVHLTPREREILSLITEGQLVKQTARTLGISVKTVENLQRRLFKKLGARNRAHAIARAHELGLLVGATDSWAPGTS